MSFKNTNEILGGFTLWPREFTLANYAKILTDHTWYMGYVNSLVYVLMKHGDFGHRGAGRRPTRSRATAFSATSTFSSGC